MSDTPTQRPFPALAAPTLATMQVMPPNSPDLEQSVLTHLIVSQSRDIAAAVFGLLVPEDFYTIRHRLIFVAAHALHYRGRIIDYTLLKAELEQQGTLSEVGGSLALTELTACPLWTPDIEGVCQELVALTTRRQLIEAASTIAQLAYDTAGSIDVQHAKALTAVRDVRTTPRPTASLAEVASSLIDELAYYKANPLAEGEVRGLATGLVPLDQLLAGIYLDDFIVLAGRPGTGKTALCLQVADQVAMSGKRVLLFSFEMKTRRLLRRLASRRALVDWEKVKRGTLTPDEEGAINYHLVELAEMGDRLIIDDVRAGLAQMEAAIIKHWPIDLVVVDNLHIVLEPRKRDENDTHYYGRISRGLFDLAKSPTHPVPVLTIAHMNRDSERGARRKPNLTDLRESGEIEQNVDTALFMWVPDPDAEPSTIEIFAGKMRDGNIAIPAKLYFDKPHQRFGRLADHQRPISF